jgi:hypothetical protein
VHSAYHGDMNDNEALSLFSSILVDINKGRNPRVHFDDNNLTHTEAILAALMEAVRRPWRQHEDVVNPLGDKRGVFAKSVWIFDLVRDVLYHNKADLNSRIPLYLALQRPVTASDFEPYEKPAMPPKVDLTRVLPGPYWKPIKAVPERTMRLATRMLDDFNFQWRHIFRNAYNDATFRRLARAIVRISSMDFNIVEVSGRRCRLGEGPYVSNFESPKWKTFDSHVVSASNVRIVLSQDLGHAIRVAQDDFIGRRPSQGDDVSGAEGAPQIYLALSVRHVLLCHVSDGCTKYSKPEPLLDGVNSPSDRAVELLLMAVNSSNLAHSRLNRIPPELQDEVLSHVSLGPLKAAQLGCLLNIGTLFRWEHAGRAIKSDTALRTRVESSAIEQQIFFDNCSAGVFYR